MNIVTIDWESLGLSPRSPMLELGWVVMRMRDRAVLKTGRIPVSSKFCDRHCTNADLDTIRWWTQKCVDNPALNDYFQEALMTSYRTSEITYLDAFRDFLDYIGHRNCHSIWCTDKSFDWAALEHHAISMNLTKMIPFKYKHIFETRAYKELSHTHCFPPNELSANNLPHSSQDDALYLAHCVCNLLDEIL